AARRGGAGRREVAPPTLDRVAREGALALAAMVHAPITRPSHVSIFTGLYPAQHGIRDNIARALAPDVPTMAEAFKAAGFDTAGFVSSIVLSSQSGLARGFDEFSDRFDLGTDAPDEARFLDILEKRGDVAVADASAWLERHRRQRTFAWVHLYDPHAPYEPPEPYRKRYRGRPYDGEVAYADAQLGRLLDFLERQGLRGRTLVVVTSDHGEGLGEHGEEEHMMFLYDSTLRVPFLLSWPGVLPAGARVNGQLRSVDVLPTLLDLLGLPASPATGVSRAASFKAGSRIPDSESYAESLYGSIHFGYAPL